MKYNRICTGPVPMKWVLMKMDTVTIHSNNTYQLSQYTERPWWQYLPIAKIKHESYVYLKDYLMFNNNNNINIKETLINY